MVGLAIVAHADTTLTKFTYDGGKYDGGKTDEVYVNLGNRVFDKFTQSSFKKQPPRQIRQLSKR